MTTIRAKYKRGLKLFISAFTAAVIVEHILIILIGKFHNSNLYDLIFNPILESFRLTWDYDVKYAKFLINSNAFLLLTLLIAVLIYLRKPNDTRLSSMSMHSIIFLISYLIVIIFIN